jgi:alpha-amylase/alpha-mannosidase (GH57 family)
MSDSQLRVAFLWHLHQPFYRDLRTGAVRLPWVRLQAARNYLDLALVLADFPDVPQTVNLVPCLVEQLLDDAPDSFLELAAADPAGLGGPDRARLLAHFFSVNLDREVLPHPRYRELLARRGEAPGPGRLYEAAGEFGEQELRDLQTLFLLAWCGNSLRRDPHVSELRGKGEGYSEEEKQGLLERMERSVRQVVPAFRGLREAGHELSASPYFHPILPMLLDPEVVREPDPHVATPGCEFRWVADAALQLRLGLARHEEAFGEAPCGVWPSEGAISEEALQLLDGAGVRWTVTDLVVLQRALGSAGLEHELRRPYRLRETHTAVFFRDPGLSDLIGFRYSGWEPEEAARDLLARMRGVRDALGSEAGEHVLTVALDGENPWGAYPDNGEPFLRALLQGLRDDEALRAVTFSQALEEGGASGTLGRLPAGTWAGGNFRCWVGHPEKNRAWQLLARVRDGLGAGALDPNDAAHRSMLAAEGSDWFWWYGEDHPTEQRLEFDTLFRDHLRNVYLLRDAAPPDELDRPIAAAGGGPGVRPPAGPLAPVLDGRRTDYLEWLGSGVAPMQGGTMHGTLCPVRAVRFGWSGSALCLLVEPRSGTMRELLEDAVLGIEAAPAPPVFFGPWGGEPSSRPDGPAPAPADVRAGVGRMLELTLPLGEGAEGGARLRLLLHDREGHELGRFPPEGPVKLPPPEESTGEDWLL